MGTFLRIGLGSAGRLWYTHVMKNSDIFTISETEQGLSNDEIAKLLERSLEERTLRNVLIIPPDFTRFHSNAGFITQVYWRLLTARGVNVDVMPALGTHVPVSETQWKTMFGDIP